MKKVFKVFKKVFDVLCWVIIAVLVVSVIISFVSKINGSSPSVFGYSIYRVSSGSMEPELEIGDIILSKAVDDPMSLKVGDVVTYKGSGELSGMFITHEIIVAPQVENGEIMLQTKGIANEVPDSPINCDRVVSVMISKIDFLAHFYNYFFSPWGLLTVIALIILIFIDELIVLLKTVTGNDTKKEPKSIDEIIGRMQAENSSGKDESEEK